MRRAGLSCKNKLLLASKCDSVRDPLLISIRWLPIVMYRWKPLKLGFRVFQDTWNGWWQSLNVFLDWSQKMQANPSQYDLWAKCRKCSYGDGELGLRPFGGFLPSCVKSLVGRGGLARLQGYHHQCHSCTLAIESTGWSTRRIIPLTCMTMWANTFDN